MQIENNKLLASWRGNGSAKNISRLTGRIIFNFGCGRFDELLIGLVWKICRIKIYCAVLFDDNRTIWGHCLTYGRHTAVACRYAHCLLYVVRVFYGFFWFCTVWPFNDFFLKNIKKEKKNAILKRSFFYIA